jgi:hypothetical protein
LYIYIILSTVYYSLYTEDGPIRAKNPINPDVDDCPSIARIDNNLVPPPHTLKSIIRHISHVESFSYSFWHRVFVDIASDSHMDDGSILILRSGAPGSVPEQPLMFVRSDAMTKPLRATTIGS